MKKIYLIQPGDPNLKTGGYIFNKLFSEALIDQGFEFQLETITAKPKIIQSVRSEFQDISSRVEFGSIVLLDGLIGAYLSDEIKSLNRTSNVYYLLHLPQWDQGNCNELEAINNSSGIIATSKYTQKLLIDKGIRDSDITVLIPPPTIFEPKNSFPQIPYKILMVASIIRRKGILEVIKLLSKIDNEWELTIFGETSFEPEYFNELHQFVKKNHIERKIRIMGAIENNELQAEYKNADLFISASNNETYGMSLWDAVYAGVPVIASNIPANQINFEGFDLELINFEDERNSLLYFKTLFNSSSTYENLVLRASKMKQIAFEYSWLQNAQQFIEWSKL